MNFSARALAAASLVALVSTIGCKPPKRKTDSTAAAASGSAGVAATAAPGGPCQKYAAALCEKAGKESESCQALTASAEILSPAACTAGLKDIAYSVKKLGEAHKSCDDLVEKLCSAIGPTTKTCDMVKTQTKGFPPARCKSMLEHVPEILVDLKKMEEANKPLSPEIAANLAKGKAPSFGPEDAKVTVVEFSDFQCPYCSRAHTTIEQVMKEYDGKVKLVYKNYPLPFHKWAEPAGIATACAFKQDPAAFWKMYDFFFNNQQQITPENVKDKAIEALAGTKVDKAKWTTCFDNKETADIIKADMAEGQSVGVTGTPAFIINGRKISGAQPFQNFKAIIDDELSRDGKS